MGGRTKSKSPSPSVRKMAGGTLTRRSSSKPQELYFKAIIRNIAEISTSGQSFNLDMWMSLATDPEPRFAELFQNAHEDAVFNKHKKFVSPPYHLNLQNCIDVKYVYKDKGLPTVRIVDDQNGRKDVYERQQKLEVVISLDVDTTIAKFKEVPVAKEGNGKKIDNFRFVYLDSSREKDRKRIGGEWHLGCSYPKSSSTDLFFGTVAHCKIHESGSEKPHQYSRVTMVIPVQRDASYYVNNIIVPLSIVTSITFCSWVMIDRLGEFLTFLVTLLLTVISIKYYVNDKLPKTSKTSFLILLFRYSYVFICSNMVLGILTGFYGCITKEQGLCMSLDVYIYFNYVSWRRYWTCAKKRRVPGEDQDKNYNSACHFQQMDDQGKLRSIHDLVEFVDTETSDTRLRYNQVQMFTEDFRFGSFSTWAPGSQNWVFYLNDMFFSNESHTGKVCHVVGVVVFAYSNWLVWR